MLPLPDSLDTAATHAETVFWDAVRILRLAKSESESQPTDVTSSESKTSEGQMRQQRIDKFAAVESFWPPLDGDNEDDAEGEEW